jgi:hypothetical protein
LFVGATVALGQTQNAPPLAASDAWRVMGESVVAPEPTVGPFSGLTGETTACCRKEWTSFTVGAEYALWFLSNSRTSIPVASSTIPPAQSASGLSTLGDAEHGKNDPSSGGRLTVGYWLVEENPWVGGGIRDLGVEGRFFFIGQRSVDFQSDALPTLVRPFFDVNNRQGSGFVVAAPGVATGGISANARIDNLWGAEANVWKSLYHDYPGTLFGLSVMGGFRYLSSDYHLQISSVSTFDANLAPTSPFFPLAGSNLAVGDSFTTHNRFYGGQVGIAGQAWLLPSMLLQAGLKIAVGVTNEDLNIAGSQVRTVANGPPQSSPGGVLALPSNTGHFNKNQFAQVPEVEARLSFRITNHVTLGGGFSALYWSRIARAAEQIDQEVTVTQLPNFQVPAGTPATNLARPSVLFRQSDLWMLGLSLGGEFVW